MDVVPPHSPSHDGSLACNPHLPRIIQLDDEEEEERLGMEADPSWDNLQPDPQIQQGKRKKRKKQSDGGASGSGGPAQKRRPHVEVPSRHRGLTIALHKVLSSQPSASSRPVSGGTGCVVTSPERAACGVMSGAASPQIPTPGTWDGEAPARSGAAGPIVMEAGVLGTTGGDVGEAVDAIRGLVTVVVLPTVVHSSADAGQAEETSVGGGALVGSNTATPFVNDHGVLFQSIRCSVAIIGQAAEATGDLPKEALRATVADRDRTTEQEKLLEESSSTRVAPLKEKLAAKRKEHDEARDMAKAASDSLASEVELKQAAKQMIGRLVEEVSRLRKEGTKRDEDLAGSTCHGSQSKFSPWSTFGCAFHF